MRASHSLVVLQPMRSQQHLGFADRPGIPLSRGCCPCRRRHAHSAALTASVPPTYGAAPHRIALQALAPAAAVGLWMDPRDRQELRNIGAVSAIAHRDLYHDGPRDRATAVRTNNTLHICQPHGRHGSSLHERSTWWLEQLTCWPLSGNTTDLIGPPGMPRERLAQPRRLPPVETPP